MSKLNDLIEQIENPELRKRIVDEVSRLNKQKKFGLVFEDHLPECTPLYDIPVKKGATVSKKSGKVNELFTVLKIDGDVATCLPSGSKEAVEMFIYTFIKSTILLLHKTGCCHYVKRKEKSVLNLI